MDSVRTEFVVIVEYRGSQCVQPGEGLRSAGQRAQTFRLETEATRRRVTSQPLRGTRVVPQVDSVRTEFVSSWNAAAVSMRNQVKSCGATIHERETFRLKAEATRRLATARCQTRSAVPDPGSGLRLGTARCQTWPRVSGLAA